MTENGMEYMKHKQEQHDNFKKEVNRQMTKEISLEKIKEALGKHKDSGVDFGITFKGSYDFIANSPEYIKWLISKVEELEHGRAIWVRDRDEKRIIFNQLQQENESLKAKVEELEVIANQDLLPETPDSVADKKEIQRLENENKELKSKVEDSVGCYYDLDEYKKENTKLKKVVECAKEIRFMCPEIIDIDLIEKFDTLFGELEGES